MFEYHINNLNLYLSLFIFRVFLFFSTIYKIPILILFLNNITLFNFCVSLYLGGAVVDVIIW